MPSTERNDSSKNADGKKNTLKTYKLSSKKKQKENWKEFPLNVENITTSRRFHGISRL